MAGITDFQPAEGKYSADYTGSFDEWVARVARELAERYAAGDATSWQSLNGATATIGQPNGSDFGTGVTSESTYDFFARYVSTYAAQDPYLSSTYGQPPTNRATYTANPSSPGATQAAGDVAQGQRQDSVNATQLQTQHDADIAQAARDAAQQASNERIEANRIASNERIQTQGDTAAMDRVKYQVDNDFKTASMQDVTARYVAEGNWGVQKYVAEMQEKGMLTRLTMELGMRDKELAQTAVAEKQRHHEAMVGLALEVAKFDAELGSEPRNWLAYASWLTERNMVVDGMNLAMAADMVPEEQAAMAAANSSSVAGSVAASMSYTQIQTQQNQPTAAPGATTSTQGVQGAPPQQAVGTTNASAAPGNQQYQVGPHDLNSTDYAGIARGLLGGAPQSQTPAALQATYDSTETNFGRAGGAQPGYGTLMSPEGVRVNANGNQENYTNFKGLLDPVQQELRLGAVQRVRGKFGLNDFVAEMERSRPKGTAAGVSGLG